MPKKQQYRLFYIALTALFIIFFYKGCISRPEMPNRSVPQLSSGEGMLSVKNNHKNSCSMEEYDQLSQKAEDKLAALYETNDEQLNIYKSQMKKIAETLKENPEDLSSICSELENLVNN